MQTAYKTPPLTLTGHPAAELDVDLLVVPAFIDDEFTDEPDLDRASGGEIGRARARGEFSGKPYEVLMTALSGWKALRLVLVGAGKSMETTADHFRRIATIGGLVARQRRMTRVAVLFRPGTLVDVGVAVGSPVFGTVEGTPRSSRKFLQLGHTRRLGLTISAPFWTAAPTSSGWPRPAPARQRPTVCRWCSSSTTSGPSPRR